MTTRLTLQQVKTALVVHLYSALDEDIRLYNWYSQPSNSKQVDKIISCIFKYIDDNKLYLEN